MKDKIIELESKQYIPPDEESAAFVYTEADAFCEDEYVYYEDENCDKQF